MQRTKSRFSDPPLASDHVYFIEMVPLVLRNFAITETQLQAQQKKELAYQKGYSVFRFQTQDVPSISMYGFWNSLAHKSSPLYTLFKLTHCIYIKLYDVLTQRDNCLIQKQLKDIRIYNISQWSGHVSNQIRTKFGPE